MNKYIIDRGVEFADANSFFSLFGPRWRVKETIINETKREIILSQGTGLLSYTYEQDADTAVQHATITARSNMKLVDFVVRFVFQKELFTSVVIAGNTVSHKDANVYYQYRTDRLTLNGPDGALEIDMHAPKTTGAFEPYLYVRDEPGHWVVHARLLPKSAANIVLKLNAP